MSETQSPPVAWNPQAKAKYDEMIAKIPLFHREIAKQVVDKKAAQNAQARGAAAIEEEDIIRAFFTEVPMTFYSLMIRLFESVGFDYKPYEPKD
ncbi:MAG: DUF2621 family protein [Candidatus Omnitrophica bacterium]|nr:DUF2621 family protein [Candidatus Omnitrophota bacterium]